MNRNRLYTANKWNKAGLIRRANLLAYGDPITLKKPTVTPYVNWRDAGQATIATGQTQALTDSMGRGADLDLNQANQMTGQILQEYRKQNVGASNGSKAAGVMGAVASAIPANSFKLGDTKYQRGLWDLADPLYQLAGNKESAVGNAMSDAGVGMTKAGLQSGNMWVALAGGITKGLGSLVNAAWGVAEDKKTKAGVDRGLAYNNKYTSRASSFDELTGPSAAVDNANIYTGGWFSKGKARRKTEALRARINTARQHAMGSLENNVKNITGDQMDTALRGYYALGGALDNTYDLGGWMNTGSPSVDFNFMSDFLSYKKRQAENTNNNMSNILASTPSSFAFGGDIEAHGSDWPTQLTHIDAGGSHSENPYSGVQMGADGQGTPNLVEEGEVVWEDYVFSNRIELDEEAKKTLHFPKKAKITYADAAKKLEKEIAERPNDPISQAGFKAQMQTLEEQQERQKQEMEAERARRAFEALPEEEKIALMQRTAQKEQMAQELAAQQVARQAMQEQDAQQQMIGQPTPEEAAMMEQQMAQQQMMPQGAPMQEGYAEGGHLFAPGGSINPYAYDTSWEGFPYYNPSTEAYDSGYLDFLKTIDQSWIDRLMKGEFGELTRYLSKNKGKALTLKDVIRLASDKKNSDIHKAMAKAYDEYTKQKETGVQSKVLPEVEVTGERGENNSNTNPSNFGDWWYKYITQAQMANDWKGADWNKLYASIAGKDNPGAADSESVQKALAELYATNPDLFRPYDLYNYSYFNPEFVIDESTLNALGAPSTEAVDETPDSPTTVTVPTETSIINNPWTPTTLDEIAAEDEDVPYPLRTAETTIINNPWTPKDGVVTIGGNEADVKKDNKKKEKEGDDIPEPKDHWLRYASLFGPAVGLGLMAAGVGKPDYSRLDAALASLGEASKADWKPIGNYLTYRPMDIWYEQNRLDANSRATDRAIMNNATPIGTKNASLLANAYINQLASGDLYRKALEYNDALKARTEEFNRGTDQFNATAYNQNSQFNAQAENAHKMARAKYGLNAAAQRLDSDAGWYNSLYGNVSGLFKGLADLGADKTEKNWLKWLVNRGALGELNGYSEKAAYGGKIAKKKKRGLTC